MGVSAHSDIGGYSAKLTSHWSTLLSILICPVLYKLGLRFALRRDNINDLSGAEHIDMFAKEVCIRNPMVTRCLLHIQSFWESFRLHFQNQL